MQECAGKTKNMHKQIQNVTGNIVDWRLANAHTGVNNNQLFSQDRLTQFNVKTYEI